MVTWNVPEDANVHDNVELPVPVTLVGVRVHDVLLLARFTTPANPFRPLTMIVDEAGEPGVKLTEVGLAVIVKSWTMDVTVTE